MPKVRFKDKDRGWKRLQREIKKARRKPHVAVGIFGSKAAADHGGTPNIRVAVAHELGLEIQHPGGTAYFVKDGRAVFVSNEAAKGKDLPRTKPHMIKMPERSFIRGTVDAKGRRIAKMAKTLMEAVFRGRGDTRKALGLLGVFVQGLIRGRMSQGIPPPLKAATIKRKGSSKPLIDTGQLRSSIDLKVKNA